MGTEVEVQFGKSLQARRPAAKEREAGQCKPKIKFQETCTFCKGRTFLENITEKGPTALRFHADQAGRDAKHGAGLRRAQAAMARKLRDSDIATQWTLNYQLTSRLRMQFTLASASPYPRTLLCQYSTGETPPPPMPR